MEADMVAQMVKDLVVVEKINVSEIAGDDDSTGFEKIKKQMPHLEIEKTSDRNHIKKNVNSKLYELKNSKMHKEFTQKVLDSIQKNFSYMIDQNQGSEDGIKNGLKAITEHMFGNHTFCNVSWCGGLTKGDAYKHLNLPYGKDLTSKQLKADLEKIFQNKLLTKANQLSKLSSSQANESFNNTVASKAPKRLHYSGSASLGYRVCSAVLQKNEGYEYMSKVNEAAGLSPGNETLKRAAISLDNDVEEEIPEPLNIRIEGDMKSSPLVVFDLETTGLSRTSDIVQIAAYSEEKKFDTYVMPNKPISPEAAAITGITVVGNQMLYNKERVMHKSQFQALNDFIIYLSTFSKKPILVGHNIKRFDCHVLYNSLKSHMLWNEFCSYVHCFVDSLDLFKHVKPGLKSYSQTNLVHELLGETYEAHNAVDDTAILNKLISTKCDFDLYVQTLSFSCLYPYFCFFISM
ncbi:maternal protein exuperantia [Mytilus galloprovincialis]|uniref:Maternal protein exuperantia n=1 Tax=Mytilus galloprovincialis TaxID=29158 RepID=A0A8B6HLE8_MYTGA|nr:maternal protein exuperantia [Mytilus galloprovincialis]